MPENQYQKLQELATLKEQGLLTVEEFDARRREILGDDYVSESAPAVPPAEGAPRRESKSWVPFAVGLAGIGLIWMFIADRRDAERMAQEAAADAAAAEVAAAEAEENQERASAIVSARRSERAAEREEPEDLQHQASSLLEETEAAQRAFVRAASGAAQERAANSYIEVANKLIEMELEVTERSGDRLGEDVLAAIEPSAAVNTVGSGSGNDGSRSGGSCQPGGDSPNRTQFGGATTGMANSAHHTDQAEVWQSIRQYG